MSYQPTLVKPEIVKRCFNGKEKDCLLVNIEGEDYESCDKVSQGDNYWANSKPGAYGAGLGNTSDDKYKTTRTGLLGQMAFGKLFNQPVDLDYKQGGDKYDNKIGKYTYDMKCAMRNYGEGLIYHTNEWGRKQSLSKDIYVFAYIESENRTEQKATIIFTGFALRWDIEKCKVEPGRKGNGHLNYVASFSELKSIVKLLELKNQVYGE